MHPQRETPMTQTTGDSSKWTVSKWTVRKRSITTDKGHERHHSDSEKEARGGGAPAKRLQQNQDDQSRKSHRPRRKKKGAPVQSSGVNRPYLVASLNTRTNRNKKGLVQPPMAQTAHEPTTHQTMGPKNNGQPCGSRCPAGLWFLMM
jgi:hypothetical protein